MSMKPIMTEEQFRAYTRAMNEVHFDELYCHGVIPGGKPLCILNHLKEVGLIGDAGDIDRSADEYRKKK